MKEQVRIRRILVALDASADSLAAAWTAAELAGALKAELTGVFVEDVKLVELSRSPLARQADLMTYSIQQLKGEELEAQMRAQARRARQELERIARRAGIKWTFRVARGSVADEILREAAEADLVTLGRTGWSFRSQRQLGKTAQSLLSQRRRTLLMGPRREVRPSLAVIYEGSETGREGLQLAIKLAQAGRSPLSVLLLGKAGQREQLENEVRQLAEIFQVMFKVEWLGDLTAQQLARSVSRRSCRLVIAPLGQSLSSEEHLQALLNETDCLILAIS